MSRMHSALALAFFALLACTGNNGTPPGTRAAARGGTSTDYIGYASMDRDGTLHVRIYELDDPTATIDYDLTPANPNHVHVRAQADDIQPGETKKLRRVVAAVAMDADGMLSVSYMPDPSQPLRVTLPAGGPPPTQIRPGEPEYDRLIRAAGGLARGERKYIYAGKYPM